MEAGVSSATEFATQLAARLEPKSERLGRQLDRLAEDFDLLEREFLADKRRIDAQATQLIREYEAARYEEGYDDEEEDAA
jgi:hypothetical protein